MAKRTHLTAMGKSIDMGALRIINADVPAVGNMGVTASGKKIKKPERRYEDTVAEIVPEPQKKTTNVTRQIPDRSTVSARKRIAAEIENRKKFIKEQMEKDSRAQVKTELEPVMIAPLVNNITSLSAIENDLMFSPDDVDFDAEPERSQVDNEFDPLAITLEESEDTRPALFGLAGAIERARAAQGDNNESV